MTHVSLQFMRGLCAIWLLPACSGYLAPADDSAELSSDSEDADADQHSEDGISNRTDVGGEITDNGTVQPGSPANDGNLQPGTSSPSMGSPTGGTTTSNAEPNLPGTAPNETTQPGAEPAVPSEPIVCTGDRVFTGTAPLRRLSSQEYLHTLEDLFPPLRPELPVLPVEDPVDSFDNDARALGPSDVHVSRWEEIAFRTTSELVTNADALASILPCAAEVADPAAARACGQTLIASFGKQVHRRPLSTEEQSRYQTLFDEQLASIDFAAAVQLTLMAMLQSPGMLYRLEFSSPSSETVAPLDSWEVASRLSYFLWQRMPDDALFDAAEQDALLDPAEIERHVRRMLNDPRARAATADFHRQWLYFDRIHKAEHSSRLPELFPTWDAGTQAAAHEELLRFVEHSVFEGGGTLSDLLLSTQTEVDASLAALYGVPEPEDGQWASVTLPQDERAGLLTRVGFLAAHAHSANGSPPLRGAYVMQRLFCLPLPPPPPGADTSPVEASGGPLTNREAFAERTQPSDCQGCHTILDGFGFGFEHYDAVGAYRSEDNGKPVDAKVTLVGTDISGEVDGALELSARLAASPQVANCAVSRWLRYSRGRGLEAADECALERLGAEFEQSGGNLVELMVAIATSPEFLNRPAEQEQP